MQERLSEEGGKIVLGTAESFREQGRKEARQEITKNLLLLSFDKTSIMQAIEVSEEELEKIIDVLV